MHKYGYFLASVLLAVLFAVSVSADEYFDDDTEEHAPSQQQHTPGRHTVQLLSTVKSNNVNRGMAGIAWHLVKLSDFYYEIAAIIILAVVLAAHHAVRAVNQAVATSWMKDTIAIWQANFAHFGDDKHFSLIRDGPYDFIFYASGRVFVKKVYGFIKLVSRYDPIGFVVSNPYLATANSVKHDSVVMDFHIADELPRLFFAIIAKNQYPNIKRKRYDVADFGALAKLPASFPKEHYVVLTDAPELANAILSDTEIVNALWAAAGLEPLSKAEPTFFVPLLESLIITDQGRLAELPATPEELSSFPKMMHVSLKIEEGGAQHGNVAQKLVQLVLDVLDHYGDIELSVEGHNKIKKTRLAAEEKILKRQEEIRKRELRDIKYQAEKRKEEEVGKMSAEQQRKFNEEKRKKELKKKSKMGKIVM
ncbi:hypothetical protein HDU81_002047 [Chytriomyces hyalinus]|nr:hypothetical protein HDU81_002047 [Chytriomyces hyalinus]